VVVDKISVVAPNCPAIYEMHFGVPMAGLVLNTMNTRIDANTLSVLFRHCETKAIFVDLEYLPLVHKALQIWLSSSQPPGKKPHVIAIEDRCIGSGTGSTSSSSKKKYLAGWGELVEYEELLQNGDPQFVIQWPADEWDTISLNYTSGTTSQPKGVLYHHRGTYLMSLITVHIMEMNENSVFLWTVPMFHCNGWCYTWGIAALAGTNIIIRSVDVKLMYELIAKHKVTTFCAVPVVLNMIVNAEQHIKKPLPGKVTVVIGGASPPPSVIIQMEQEGFSIFHVYGLTEAHGGLLLCNWKPEWDDLPVQTRARLKARQGILHVGLQAVAVLNPSTMEPVLRDGVTVGEIMAKGSTIMKGYLKDQEATRRAFEGGWFHTGDLAVVHPDGYIEIKDRSKDIIISGGENISSIEVESVLYQHPDIFEAAVVARPDPFWGETPCAFIKLKETGNAITPESLIAYCREHLPRFAAPKTVIFCDLPKTATGKIQKNVLRERAKALDPGAQQSSKL
jgi:acyl-CoA synthetase (AMP-forming)/AMP-acid ligase II